MLVGLDSPTATETVTPAARALYVRIGGTVRRADRRADAAADAMTPPLPPKNITQTHRTL